MSEALTWRPLTVEDAEASADLLAAIEAVDQIGENYTAEDTLQELLDPYADLERASLAAFDGDVMVGFMKARYKPVAEDVHRIFIDGGVHPAYRRRGIGTTLLNAAMGASRDLHERHHPALKLVLEVQKAEHTAGVAELLGSRGFAPIRYYQHMEHPLGAAIRDTPVPAGLRVEPWSDRVRLVRMSPSDGIPPVVLVRPDAYVAWATEEPETYDAVRSALAEWCGQPATVVH